MSELLAGLANDQLLARLRDLVQRGNAVEAELLAHLGEVDARRSHPELLEAVRRGELHLTAVGLLAPKLTGSNCAELMTAARHRSAEEIRQLLADREPRPEVHASVRKLPEPTKQAAAPALPQVDVPRVMLPDTSSIPGESSTPPPVPRLICPERGVIEPLGAERYRVQFTADRALYAQLLELRALMRHQVPDGDLGKILAHAVAVLLAQVRKRKFAETSEPKPARPSDSKEIPSRHIPAAIRRAVWNRDGGRCGYVSARGRRCDSQEFLEFDHAEAWAWTRAHSIAGITLRCRAHNQQRARRDFGERHMARFRKQQPSTGFESSSPGSSSPE